MDMFQLYRANKRVTLRTEDMTKEKIAVIFQVKMDLLYLQNDSNVAIFAEPDGQFNCYDLLTSSHYEVQGESSIVEVTPPPPPSSQDHHPTRFSFHRPATSTAASASAACLIPRATVPKLASKTLQVGHLVNGKLETSENVTVRFSEFEANIGAITAKVIEALGVEENMVLTDKSGTRFVDSEGTRGFDFWRSNAKKVWAVPEQQFQQLHKNKKRRLSRDDAGLRDVVGDIDELIEAAQNLREVTAVIKELSGVPSTLTSTLSLSETEVASMRSAFGCLVCKGLIEVPMFATCCRSIIGCKVCVEECRRTNSTCPKCRNVDFVNRIIEMAALDDALAPIGKLFY